MSDGMDKVLRGRLYNRKLVLLALEETISEHGPITADNMDAAAREIVRRMQWEFDRAIEQGVGSGRRSQRPNKGRLGFYAGHLVKRPGVRKPKSKTKRYGR